MSGTAPNRVEVAHWKQSSITGQFIVGTLKSVVGVAPGQGQQEEERINNSHSQQCFMSEATMLDHTLRINASGQGESQIL